MPSTAQSAPESDEKKSRGLGSYVVWAFVAVMVYVLSSGPTQWLGVKQVIGPMEVFALNRPLYWLYSHTPIKTPLGMYWHLWCPQVYAANGQHLHDVQIVDE
jgi:hypothetical protein